MVVMILITLYTVSPAITGGGQRVKMGGLLFVLKRRFSMCIFVAVLVLEYLWM